MKREDIVRIFADATADQIKEIMDLHGAGINKAKGDVEQLQNQLTTAQNDLTVARNTITELEKAKGNADELQKQIDAYKQADADRQAAEAAAAEQTKLEQRMEAALNGRKFNSDFARRGVLEDFGKALKDAANVGKSDAEIFSALTKDQNVFASQNPPAPGMPGINPDIGGDDLDALSDADYYARVFKKE